MVGEDVCLLTNEPNFYLFAHLYAIYAALE